jgi:oligopeptidase B (EC:3.4.21.83). Serine peptidase. MEROPS family S09A
MTDESTNAAAAMPPYAKREPKRREFHGDVFEDDYEWMRDKDSDDVRSYVAAENQYCERRMAHLADFRHTLFEELKSHVEETDMSVPTRVNDYWYFTRTQQGKQYGVQCRIPVRDADDWDPPVVDPQGAPGSMPGEQVVFDANKESEGHDFFRLGGLDLSKDGRWMLYGVDVAGDERYDFRIRDLAGLETGEPVSELPEQFTGIGSACFTPDGQWVFWVELDDSWRPLAVWRHRVGTAVESDVCVYRETDERFWVGVGISFDERNIVIGTGSKTTTEVLMLPVATPEGEFQAFIPRQNDIEYDVSFACFEGAGRTVRMCHSPWSITTLPIRISKSTSLTCVAMSRRTDSAKACALPPGRRTAVNMVSRISRLPRHTSTPSIRRYCRVPTVWASKASRCIATLCP